MLNNVSHQGNTKQNHNEISLYKLYMTMTKTTDKSGETEKLIHCYTDVKCAGGLENSLVVPQKDKHGVNR